MPELHETALQIVCFGPIHSTRETKITGSRLLHRLATPPQDPVRVGKIRGPDHVHADDVDILVTGRKAAHDLFALLIRIGGQSR